MDVLSSRILLRPGDMDRSRRFCRDTLGLAITPAEAQDSARPRSRAAYAAQPEPLSAG